MDKDWIIRALAMHAALMRPPAVHLKVGDVEKATWADDDAADLQKRAERYAEIIAAFANAALQKPVDPFS